MTNRYHIEIDIQTGPNEHRRHQLTTRAEDFIAAAHVGKTWCDGYVAGNTNALAEVSAVYKSKGEQHA